MALTFQLKTSSKYPIRSRHPAFPKLGLSLSPRALSLWGTGQVRVAAPRASQSGLFQRNNNSKVVGVQAGGTHSIPKSGSSIRARFWGGGAGRLHGRRCPWKKGVDIAGMGGLMGAAMPARNFSGAMIDGGVRDVAYLNKIGFPSIPWES